MSVRLSVLLVAALLSAAGCTTQTVRLAQSGQEAIELLMALPAEARPRVVVAPLRDHTRGDGRQYSSLEAGLVFDRAGADGEQFLAGIHDLLVTALLNSGAFTVLERQDLGELASERLLRAEAGETVSVDASLEGADFIVAAAVTGFEQSGGGGLPLPLPVGNDGHFGLLWLKRGVASLSMDIRVLDVRTGRVVHATGVRGSARRFGVDLDAYVNVSRHGYLALPGVLGYYNKTPMHAALLEMITLAVARVGEAASPVAPSPLSPVPGRSIDWLQAVVDD